MSLIARLFCFSHDYVRVGYFLVCRDCGHRVHVGPKRGGERG